MTHHTQIKELTTWFLNKYLNCLSSSHSRANCCLPTRCFNYHGFWHHLMDCKCPCKSSISFEVSEVVSQTPRDTLSSLGDKDTPSTQACSVASCFPEPDHSFPVASMYFIPRSWDLVIEEAALGTTVVASGRSCQEEIAIMVEQLSNPPLIAISSCLSKPLPPVDIQTQQLCKSEEEQLVGPPLSPLVTMNHPWALKQLLFIQKRIRVPIDRGKFNPSLEN
jgi:hypothetical protein